jgi:hypothetical protein
VRTERNETAETLEIKIRKRTKVADLMGLVQQLVPKVPNHSGAGATRACQCQQQSSLKCFRVAEIGAPLCMYFVCTRTSSDVILSTDDLARVPKEYFGYVMFCQVIIKLGEAR